MNILDENIIDPQCELLKKMKVRFRQIGDGIGRLSMSDREIIVLLHGLNQPTLFTQDWDYYKRSLCHAGYCLIHLVGSPVRVAESVRRVLKHRLLNTRAKRMGFVLSASPDGLTGWRVNQQASVQMSW